MANRSNRALSGSIGLSRAPPHSDYGVRLARLRELAGLSQSELGRSIGVQPGAINHIEAGRVLPRADKLRALALALGVNTVMVVP
jgi:ribosome-binding protein aMBF1 (putative translation factor)